jgi:uncharacterized protein YndB with AHSA1/START domain
MSSLSEVSTQGAVARKVTVRMTEMGMTQEKAEPAKMITFTTPGLWKIETRKEKEEQVLEATRSLPSAGENGSDFQLSDGGTGKARCEVKVVKRDDGLLEYTETWTWLGPKGTALSEQLNKDSSKVFAAKLSAAGFTEAETKQTIERLGKKIFRVVMGPSEPLLPTLIMDTGLAMRKLRIQMAGEMDAVIGEIKPDLPATEKRALTVSILADLTKELENSRSAGPSESAPGESNSGQLVSLELAVAGPGQVVETNGIADPIDGRVYWNMYLEACEHEPVVLRAVFRP